MRQRKSERIKAVPGGGLICTKCGWAAASVPALDDDTRREGFLALNSESRVEVLADFICADLESMNWGEESSETMADTLARRVADLIESTSDEDVAAYLGGTD